MTHLEHAVCLTTACSRKFASLDIENYHVEDGLSGAAQHAL